MDMFVILLLKVILWNF